jgi:hypothetical protein
MERQRAMKEEEDMGISGTPFCQACHSEGCGECEGGIKRVTLTEGAERQVDRMYDHHYTYEDPVPILRWLVARITELEGKE